MCFNVKPTYLLMDISSPDFTYNTLFNPFLQPYNSSILFNVTLKCVSEGNGGCSEVKLQGFYNKSSSTSDTITSTSPFSWKYRRKIVITHADRPVIITLTPSNFDYSKTKPDGSDIRFTLYDKSTGKEKLIPFYIYVWNTSGESKIIVNTMSWKDEDEIVYMYYGNPKASNMSSERQAMIIENWNFERTHGWRCFEDELLNFSESTTSDDASPHYCNISYPTGDAPEGNRVGFLTNSWSTDVSVGNAYCGAFGAFQEITLPNIKPLYLHTWIFLWTDQYARIPGIVVEDGVHWSLLPGTAVSTTYNFLFGGQSAGGSQQYQQWKEYFFNLTPWAGKTIRLKFTLIDLSGTHCDGYGDHDAQILVDDMYLTGTPTLPRYTIQIYGEETGTFYPEGDWDYRILVKVNSTYVSRENWIFMREINFTDILKKFKDSDEFDPKSVRVFETDSSGTELLYELPTSFKPAQDFDAQKNAHGMVYFLVNGTTPANTARYFWIYFSTNRSKKNYALTPHEILELNPFTNSLIESGYWFASEQRTGNTTSTYRSEPGPIMNPAGTSEKGEANAGDIVTWGMCTGIIIWEKLYELTGEEFWIKRANLSLQWLKNMQNPDGSWYLQYHLDGDVEYADKLPGTQIFCARAGAYYQELTGEKIYENMTKKAIEFLRSLQNQTDGGIENHYYGDNFKFTFEAGEAIRAFNEISTILQNSTYIDYAQQAFDFIFQGWNSTGYMYYEYKNETWGTDYTRYPMPAQALTNWMGVLYFHPENSTAVERAKYAMKWIENNAKWSAEPAYDKDTAVDYVYPHYSAEAVGAYVLLFNVTKDPQYFQLANSTLWWILSMQIKIPKPSEGDFSGGFYDSKSTSDGSIDHTAYSFHQGFPGLAILDYLTYAAPQIKILKYDYATQPYHLCELDNGESCNFKLAFHVDEPIGSIWKGQLKAVSRIPTIAQNDSAEFFFKIVFAVKTLNLTVLNSSANINQNSIIKLYDSQGNFMEEKTGEIFKQLEYLNNYTLEIENSTMKVTLHNINLTNNLTIISQIVDDYKGNKPSNIAKITPVFALNDTNLKFSYATLYIPKNNINVNKILHCLNWNFSTANCLNWEVNDLSYYNTEQNTTHIWFNVTNFYAYAGGEAGANSKLEIWDETDFYPQFPNEKIYFYANYSNSTSGKPIYAENVSCNISFQINGIWTNWEEMTFNSTSNLYEYSKIFSNPGIYLWNVSCNGSALGYSPLNTSDSVVISPLEIEITTLSSPNYGKNSELNYVYFLVNNIINSLLLETGEIKELQASSNNISLSASGNSKIFLIFTKYNKDKFEKRAKMVKDTSYLNYGKFTFGYELSKKFIVRTILKYINIDLEPEIKVLLPGEYRLLVQKIGSPLRGKSMVKIST